MLACVYPAENFKSKAVTVKLRHAGKSKKRTKLLSVKEKTPSSTTSSNNNKTLLQNQVSLLCMH